MEVEMREPTEREKEILEMLDRIKTRELTINKWEDVSPRPIYLVAAEYRKAYNYASSIGLKRNEWKFINDEHNLDGIDNAEIRMLADFYRHPKFDRINERILYLESLKRVTVQRYVEW
jgi:hypothetical protein